MFVFFLTYWSVSKVLMERPFHSCDWTRVDGANVDIWDCEFWNIWSMGAGDEYNASLPEVGNGYGGAIYVHRSTGKPGDASDRYSFFRVRIGFTWFIHCWARVRGGGIDLVVQTVEINTTLFENCTAGESAAAGYVQVVGYPDVGWLHFNTSEVLRDVSPHSNMHLIASIYETLTPGGLYNQNLSLICMQFNFTGCRANGSSGSAYGAALYLEHHLNLTLEYVRFQSNEGRNILRLGTSTIDSQAIFCISFINNTVHGSDTIGGILYSADTYYFMDVVFLNNTANHHIIVASGHHLTFIECIFDSHVQLSGSVTTLDCRTSFSGTFPDHCHFVDPTVPRSRTRSRSRTQSRTRSKSPSRTASRSSTPVQTHKQTPSRTATRSMSFAATHTSHSRSITKTPSPTASRSTSHSPTHTSHSRSITKSPSPTRSHSYSRSKTPTISSHSVSRTAHSTIMQSKTPSISATSHSQSISKSPSPSRSKTPTISSHSVSRTPSISATSHSRSVPSSPFRTGLSTPSRSRSPTMSSHSASRTHLPTASRSRSRSMTHTISSHSYRSTVLPTASCSRSISLSPSLTGSRLPPSTHPGGHYGTTATASRSPTASDGDGGYDETPTTGFPGSPDPNIVGDFWTPLKIAGLALLLLLLAALIAGLCICRLCGLLCCASKEQDANPDPLLDNADGDEIPDGPI